MRQRICASDTAVNVCACVCVRRQCLQQMNTYSDEARHQFEHCLGWLNQWACSRSFGLGTRVPWDTQYLVESLSDSTIYMAYYTVAHFLQAGNLYGEGDGKIKAEDVTDEVTAALHTLVVQKLWLCVVELQDVHERCHR